MKLKIMSYNIQHAKNYISKEINYDALVNAIKEINPDVLSLNEVYSSGFNNTEEGQAKIIADKLGYNYYFGKATTIRGIEYGNAILSKYEINDPQVIKIRNPLFKIGKNHFETRSMIKAKINDITFIVSHFGLNPSEQKNAVKKVLKNLDNKKCILMGDFNMTPDNLLIKEIKNNMIDNANMLREELKTFPSDKPNIKIDYIFTSKDIDVLNFEIPELIVSDHRPVISTIII